MARFTGIVLLALAAAAPACAAGEFELIDTNDDNRISSSEHEVHARKIFDEIDANSDDRLTVKEVMASEAKFVGHVFTTGHMLGPAELTTAEKIQRVDANQDGTVSQTEHANAAAWKYQKMDLNNNGELTAEEFAAGRSAPR